MKISCLPLVFLVFLEPAIQARPAESRAKFLGNILATSLTDENFATYWNQVTPEDEGKLGYVEPTRGWMNWSVLDAMHEYAKSRGFPFKEHTLVWGRQQPDWIDSLPPDEQRLEIENWIREFGERYPDTEFIDVVNEPLHFPPTYKDALGGDGTSGWDWVVWAYSTAREYCPQAKLLLNDYFVPGRSDLEQFATLVNILKWQNLVDGIGVQLHAFEEVSDDVIRSTLDRLGSLGLPVYISELDINDADDDAQLKRFETLFPILWQHPAVKGITLWGYKQYHIWRQQAYLLRADGTERPALTWLKQYVRDHDATALLKRPRGE